MCGIAGIFHLDGERTVDPTVLARMTRTLVHRGPDDEGFFVDGPVGLGARRLSIVDRALGHQPLSTEDGKVWIAFNGEIYNHPDLRRELLGRGHTYRTNCDTETVAHAYEEFGEGMVDRLRGMFAFAIWDAKQRRLRLYRDRLGIKPLYYGRFRDTLLFASEAKALLAYGLPFEVEDTVLECYLRLGYVPGERTLFRGIWRLPPGHYLVADVGKQEVRTRRYWRPTFAGRPPLDDAASARELEQLLEETIAQHRQGEVPQGIFLSGGVDSSSLLAIHARQVDEPVLTFSVGYRQDRGTSELPHARRVARMFGARHFEYELSLGTFAEALPKLVWHMDEPVADMAAIPLYFIAQLAREHITVVHSGEGADEILAGYGIYRRMAQLSEWQRRLGPWSGRLGRRLRAPWLPYRVQRYAEWLGKPLADRYHGVRALLTDQWMQRLSRNGFPTARDMAYRVDYFRHIYRSYAGEEELNQMLSADQQAWLPDDLLIKADKMTMAASIELRVPFLDHRVVEFAGSLPTSMKLRNGHGKFLLKHLMRPHLPADVLDAPKRGFPVPLCQWYRDGLYPAARAWLLDSPFLREIFLPGKLEELLTRHRREQADFSAEIHGLACLSIWHDMGGRARGLAS